MTNNSKKGFTLVELSIVLVIIGLLIGGILVAQSMIGTAKIQALSRQFGQFDSAVANYQTKFNQLPGDSSLMGATPGDNNGSITDTNGAITIASFKGEMGKFWYDLSQSGMSSGSSGYTDNSAAASLPTNASAPKATAGTNAFVVAYAQPTQLVATGAITTAGNYYAVGPVGGTAGANAMGVGFKPADVLALDLKIDDGNGGAGNVQGSVASATYTETNGTACNAVATAGPPVAGGAYAVATTTDVCSVRVRMGTSTGVLQ